MDSNKLGAMCLELRAKLHLSQLELANRLGVSRYHVMGLENGNPRHKNPHAVTVRKVERLYAMAFPNESKEGK